MYWKLVSFRAESNERFFAIDRSSLFNKGENLRGLWVSSRPDNNMASRVIGESCRWSIYNTSSGRVLDSFWCSLCAWVLNLMVYSYADNSSEHRRIQAEACSKVRRCSCSKASSGCWSGTDTQKEMSRSAALQKRKPMPTFWFKNIFIVWLTANVTHIQ